LGVKRSILWFPNHDLHPPAAFIILPESELDPSVPDAKPGLSIMDLPRLSR